MATNVSQLDLQNHGTATEVTNYISQVNVGGTLYDVATHHGIKFKNGASDRGIVWNGITDIEVIIPTLAELVQDPIRFAGTVGSDGKPKAGSEEITPAHGDLVFITADCTFDGKACEAGDMAVYSKPEGTATGAWYVVSGENQVVITSSNGIVDGNNTTFTLNATAKDVLSVEGKHILLNVDYTGVKDVMSAEMNDAFNLNVTNGKVTVSGQYLKLSQAEGSTEDISTEVSIDLPTALASGVVTISDKVFDTSDFHWNAGVLPTLKKNDSVVSVSVSNGLNIGRGAVGDSGDYVATIDGAVKSVSIVGNAAGQEGAFKVITGVTVSDGSKTFVSGLHAAATQAELDGQADFVIPGKPSVASTGKTFVSGLGDAAASGDLVSSINVGEVTFDSSKSDFVTGLGTAAAGQAGAVLTGVTFGGAVEDTSASWFVKGLGDEKTSGFDVITSVSIGATTLVSANDFATPGIVSASVSGNVLSFVSGNFMTPMNVSTAAHTIKGKSFTMSGVKLSGFAAESADFVKGGFAQADTVISYKSVLTGDVALSFASDTKYYLDTKAADEYTFTSDHKKLSVTNATITYASPALNGTVTANIPVDQVVVDFSVAGTLPSWSVDAASRTISGTVGTSLTTSSVSWLGVDASKKDVAIAGAWSLISTEDSSNAIEVGVAGEYALTGAIAAVAADTFVTDVLVDNSSIIPAPVQNA